VAAPPVPSPEAAARLLTLARQQRALAGKMRENGDPTSAIYAARDARFMEDQAEAGLDPLSHTSAPLVPARGGEMVAATRENIDEQPWLLDTVNERPDMLAADASVKRMQLADGAGALVLGLDLAETIQAQNSAERALAHQLAAAHRLAMRMVAKADDFMLHATSFYPPGRQQVQSIEAARMAASAARLMDTFQRGLLTLERLHNGGRQTVVVQHVDVCDGGQAVVAGSVAPGGGRAPGGEAR
jgi:hypothetical protein